MKKICVFSDSHGSGEGMELAVRAERPDLVIHLGDGERDLYRLEKLFPSLRIENVRGNCDWQSPALWTLRLTVEGKRIFAVHGHAHEVKRDPSLARLKKAALEDGADIVLFGHTHSACVIRDGGMDIMNPGSIGEGAARTYGVIVVDGGVVKMELRRV